MRQGGMKPKGHSSGTYWVRANAKSGGGKKKKSLKQTEELEGDYNDDGIVDKWDNLEQTTVLWSRIGGFFVAIIIVIAAVIF
jgi:hypothetical protein